MTPVGSSPASRAKSTAASVCPARCNTPPSRACNGKTCPGSVRSSGTLFVPASVLIVLERSRALMPVVMPRAASTETVKSVRCNSRLCATMRCKPSWRARSSVSGTQIRPRPFFAMKLTASGVTFDAAMTRSPSFSRSASSVTMTSLPARISRSTDSMESKDALLTDPSVKQRPTLWAMATAAGRH